MVRADPAGIPRRAWVFRRRRHWLMGAPDRDARSCSGSAASPQALTTSRRSSASLPGWLPSSTAYSGLLLAVPESEAPEGCNESSARDTSQIELEADTLLRRRPVKSRGRERAVRGWLQQVTAVRLSRFSFVLLTKAPHFIRLEPVALCLFDELRVGTLSCLFNRCARRYSL